MLAARHCCLSSISSRASASLLPSTARAAAAIVGAPSPASAALPAEVADGTSLMQAAARAASVDIGDELALAARLSSCSCCDISKRVARPASETGSRTSPRPLGVQFSASASAFMCSAVSAAAAVLARSASSVASSLAHAALPAASSMVASFARSAAAVSRAAPRRCGREAAVLVTAGGWSCFGSPKDDSRVALAFRHRAEDASSVPASEHSSSRRWACSLEACASCSSSACTSPRVGCWADRGSSAACSAATRPARLDPGATDSGARPSAAISVNWMQRLLAKSARAMMPDWRSSSRRSEAKSSASFTHASTSGMPAVDGGSRAEATASGGNEAVRRAACAEGSSSSSARRRLARMKRSSSQSSLLIFCSAVRACRSWLAVYSGSWLAAAAATASAAATAAAAAARLASAGRGAGATDGFPWLWPAETGSATKICGTDFRIARRALSSCRERPPEAERTRALAVDAVGLGPALEGRPAPSASTHEPADTPAVPSSSPAATPLPGAAAFSSPSFDTNGSGSGASERISRTSHSEPPSTFWAR
mmetsp:Transcript_116564/g.341116  ORF Transcript_116564/g.341116 Transcript_116564/m.341116 type:complete len:542 (+) Transcript_116564:297-1922(+)